MHQNNEDSLFENVCGMSVSEMRYYEVQTRLDARNVRKIIDLGCSEGLFLQRLSRSETYTRLVGVDIDNELLEATTRWNVMPEALQNDIKYRRTQPLLLELYQGDILQPSEEVKSIINEADSSNFPTAITLIQVIEHLQLEQVPQLSEIVFQYYQPPLVVITTPNTDFNFYFGREGSIRLRHWDHKFEWNRQQFEQYCKKVCEQYGYEYQTFGVGYPKSGERQRGACTQGAIFTHKEKMKVEQFRPLLLPPASIRKVVSLKYPFWRQSLQKDITLAVYNAVRSQSFHRGLYVEEDNFNGYPLDELLSEKERDLISRYNVSTQTALNWISQSKELLVMPENRVRYNQVFFEQLLEEEQRQKQLEEEYEAEPQ